MISFKLFDCKIELRFSFFALLAACCIFAGTAGSAAFMAAVILHETAHIITMFVFGASPESVIISALGCRIISSKSPSLSCIKSALVSLSGPLVNLLLFSFCLIVGEKGSDFAIANLVLGVFHILPIEPMDGGLAMRSLIRFFTDDVKAKRISFTVSLVLLFPLAVAGFMLLLVSKFNFSLLALCVYIMLYLLMKKDFLIS